MRLGGRSEMFCSGQVVGIENPKSRPFNSRSAF
jgi:hypothetical protein